MAVYSAVIAGRFALLIVVATSSCGHDAAAPDRLPPRAPSRIAIPHDARGDEVGPPPGTAELVRVPPDVVAKVALREIAHGLHRPVLVTFAPGDARRRLFVVEQRGKIRVIEHGQLVAQAFFAMPAKQLSDGNEQGLLGLAFHPQFAANGKLYIDFTTRDKATHIVELHVAPAGDVVDPASAREIFTVAHPYSNHNGGNLAFGPDGKLYAGMGDGGSANDPHGNGQNPHALLAKILRFDVDHPRDNGTPAPEIVHLGMRNPWRFWFDRATGDLFIGDVGQNLWEEIDVVAHDDRAVHNFGWNLMEGTHCFDADTGRTKADCDRAGLTAPVVEYPHEQGCSVTGGVTYRGKALAAILDGEYFYADFCTALLRSFRYVRGAVRDHWDWKAALDPDGELTQPSSFGTDEDGEVYIVSLDGNIFELVPRS